MTAFEKIIVAVFAFSLVTAMLNLSGVWGDGKLPTQDDTMGLNNTAKIEELTGANKAEAGYDFIGAALGPVKLLLNTLSFLKELVMSTLNIGGVLASYGVPEYIRTPIYGMLILSAVFMLLRWMAGRQ